jgi:hypothetical protein
MPPVDGGSKRLAAILASVGFSALFVFEVLLAAGAPPGDVAFGGSSVVLPSTLRVASAVSALLFLGAIWAVLSGAGVVRVGAGPVVVRRVLWCYVGLFGLSALTNLASPSPWERLLMTPLAVLLAACCVIVARRPDPLSSVSQV